MMKLNELLTEWHQCANLIARENEAIPPATRSGILASINQAKERAKVLQNEYKRIILSDSVAIFLDGDRNKVSEFLYVTEESYPGDILLVDANCLYDRLAESIKFVVDQRLEIGSGQLYTVFQALKDACKEAQYEKELQHPDPQTVRTAIDFGELVCYTRDLVQKPNGIQPSVAYVRLQIALAAFNADFAGSTVPVVLYNINENEKEGLRSIFTENGTLDLTLIEDQLITKEYISTQFKTVKKNLQGKQ